MTRQGSRKCIGKVVFAAMSKHNFYLREYIIKFILEKGYTPICAFMMYSYYLLDTVNRQKLIDANNDLIRRSDELWVFGDVTDGVKMEVDLAKSLNLPVRNFNIDSGEMKFIEITGS